MLPAPHGGKLVSVPDLKEELLNTESKDLLEISYETAVTVTDIKNGILSPFDGFVDEENYRSILKEQRLADGIPWSIPIMLTLNSKQVKGIKEGDSTILSLNSIPLAEIEVTQIFRFDKRYHSEKIFKTNSEEHPGVQKVNGMGGFAVAGKIIGANNAPIPFGRETMFPSQTRSVISEKGWKSVSAFQTRNVPHRGHEQIQRLALQDTDGLFINPVIGRKKKGDYTDEAIMKSYSTLIEHYYPSERVILTPLHYEMMYAGPREAVMHAIMRKNYGCSHFIVGRDHAGVGDFYGSYEAQENLRNFDDLGIAIVPFEETFYCHKCTQLVTERECSHPPELQEKFSGTKLRNMIVSKITPPPEVMRVEVYNVIKSTEKPFI